MRVRCNRHTGITALPNICHQRNSAQKWEREFFGELFRAAWEVNPMLSNVKRADPGVALGGPAENIGHVRTAD